MMAGTTAALLVLALGSMPVAASAQLSSSVEVGTLSASTAGRQWSSGLQVGPALRLDHARFTFDAAGSYIGEPGGRWRGEGVGAFAAYSSVRGGFRAVLRGEASQLATPGQGPTSQATLAGRLSWSHGAWGLWAGPEIGLTGRPAPFPPRDFRVGGWRQFGRLILSFDVGAAMTRADSNPVRLRSVPDSVWSDSIGDWFPFQRTVSDSVSSSSRLAWTDAESQAHWELGWIALRATLGARIRTQGIPGATWGSVEGMMPLTPRVALVGGAGVRSLRAMSGAPPTRYASLGLRVAAGALSRPRLPAGVRPISVAFALRAIDQNHYVVSVLAPGARTLELSGDFTRWKPVALVRRQGDVWETTLEIPRGTHRVAIRVDGERWVAPPGTTTVRDDFGGTVGIITAP